MNLQTIESSDSFAPRRLEIEALAEIIPVRGVEAHSKRIINLWGERRVGKSTFLSEFRESELLRPRKILWLQPTRNETIDTVQEFILACAKSTRYPSEPDKEKKIADRLESVQRGKINPIVSDDSILITRSRIAANKKPYINQAAASSVGRTEKVQDEVQVSVGLGESRANNQAEGFLDTLPLQSLGTDLTIVYIEDYEKLSITVRDWLRDYVIPGATRGPYRRSLVFLIESNDPFHLAHPSDNWGEWSNLLEDYRLYPMSADDSFSLGLNSGLEKSDARYVQLLSLGYPERYEKLSQAARNGAFSEEPPLDPEVLLNSLKPEEQERLVTLCLMDRLTQEELGFVFNASEAKSTLDWIKSVPGLDLSTDPETKQVALPHSIRKAVLRKSRKKPYFESGYKRWKNATSLCINVPDTGARAKLLLLSGLDWIENAYCEKLFGSQAKKVMEFIEDSPGYFNRNQERYRISERIRPFARATAASIEHPGILAAKKQATSIWRIRKAEIETHIEDLTTRLEAASKSTNKAIRKHSEVAALLRVQERKYDGETYSDATQEKANKPNRGPHIILCILLAISAFSAAFFLPNPYDSVAIITGFTASILALGLTPSWFERRKALQIVRQTQIADSPEATRKRLLDLNHTVQNLEVAEEDLKTALAHQKDLLRYPLIEE